MTLLAIDVGNTRLKWALYDGQKLHSQGRVLTRDAVDPQALEHEWRALQPSTAIVANVAGLAVAEAVKIVLAKKKIEPQFIASQTAQCGVTNAYDRPGQLGCDRWAALIGAHRHAPASSAKIVVMAGTALTVDGLSADGQFLGGIIVPGLGLMRQALHLRTAQLPSPTSEEIGKFVMFPTNTVDAITSGAIDACVGAISRLLARVAEHENKRENKREKEREKERESERGGLAPSLAPVVIASGGALALLAPHAPFALTIHENLVLDGLLQISLDSQID